MIQRKKQVLLIAFLCFCASITVCTAVAYPGKTRSHKASRWYDGMDVSHHQGKIDWKKVAKKSDVKFVYIKATQGATVVDDKYAYNNREARKHGILCGAYHYFSSASSVKDQFRAFTRVVKKKDQDLIPVIDIEREGMKHWSRKEIRRNLDEMIRLFRKHYGKAPIIYSQYIFYNEYLAPYYNHYILFLAKYSKGRPIIKGKGKVNIWQFTERGQIDGVKGRVDLNRMVGTSSIKMLKLR